jgi:hypothetical protein
MLLEDVGVIAARWRLRIPLRLPALDPLRHPWRLTLLLAALAFSATTIATALSAASPRTPSASSRVARRRMWGSPSPPGKWAAR